MKRAGISGRHIHSFAWRLEVEVWSNRYSDGRLPEGETETGQQPSLALVTPTMDETEALVERLCGRIAFDPAGWRKREGRWIVSFYPASETHLQWLRNSIFDDRSMPDLAETGEVRNPRDTPHDALALLLDQVKDETTPPVQASLAKTGALFLPLLKQMTDAWLSRNRPVERK